MEKSPEFAKTCPPSTAAVLHSLVDSVRAWLDAFLELVVLEGKKAGIGLVLMLGFGVGATVVSITGWLALVGCIVAALIENNIFGWAGSLLIAALLNFAGAVGLGFLVIKHSRDLLFSATRRQIGLKSAPKASHE